MAAPVLGIDFGTSNSAAAWVDDRGVARVVPVREGAHTLPSVVWFDKKGTVLVGQPAKEMALVDPTATIHGWKRFLGRKFQTDFVYRHKDRFPFELCAGADGLCAVKVHGEVRTLEEVTFHVIQRLLELAQAAIGQPIEEAVLTVPAHANYRQRRALRLAAEMAGLEVKALMNEPTAAAFSVLVQDRFEGVSVVFDLGGGTFDVTLLSMWQGLVQVIALDGDMFLGGQDFDQRLVDVIVERYERDKHIDLRQDPVVMQRLAFAAEQAKITLSSEELARVTIRAIAKPKEGGDIGFVDLDFGIKRGKLEQATAGLIEKTCGITRDVLSKAQAKSTKVDGVAFVGGMTRMPALRQRVLDVTGLPALEGIDPDTAVCVGAAEAARGRHVVMDVVPMSISVMVPGGVTQEIVAPSSVVPCTRHVPLPRPPSGPLALLFFEATSATATDRDPLGTARIEPDWLAAHPGELQLEVRLDRDCDLSASVKARDGALLPLKLTMAR